MFTAEILEFHAFLTTNYLFPFYNFLYNCPEQITLIPLPKCWQRTKSHLNGWRKNDKVETQW